MTPEYWAEIKHDIEALDGRHGFDAQHTARERLAEAAGELVEELERLSAPVVLPARLAEIKARCEAATAGPWEFGLGTSDPFPDPPGGIWCVESSHLEWICKSLFPTRSSQSKANMAFIAHARQDVPWLMEQVERLTRERDEAVQAKEAAEYDAWSWEGTSKAWKRATSAAQKDLNAALRKAEEAEARVGELERAEGQLIDQRDNYQQQVDSIADALGDDTEWSNCNDRGKKRHRVGRRPPRPPRYGERRY